MIITIIMLNIHSRRMSKNDSHNRAQNNSDQGCKQLPIRFTQLWPLNLQVLTWSTRQVLVLLCMSVLVEDLPSELFGTQFSFHETAHHTFKWAPVCSSDIRWTLPCLPRPAHLWELVSEASLEVGSRQTWDVTAEAKRPKWHENTMSHDVTMSYQFLAASHDLKFNLFSDRISSFAVRWCMVYRV